MKYNNIKKSEHNAGDIRLKTAYSRKVKTLGSISYHYNILHEEKIFYIVIYPKE